MAKKGKKTTEMNLNVFAPVVREIEGKIVSVDDNGITVAYKKPRKSKTTIQRFDATQIISFSTPELSEGAEIDLRLRPERARFAKLETTGAVINAPFKNFVGVDNGEVSMYVAVDCAELEGGSDEDEPSNRGRKAKKTDQDEDDAPKKRGRKAKKSDEWDDED